jgi:hypothetical protein
VVNTSPGFALTLPAVPQVAEAALADSVLTSTTSNNTTTGTSGGAAPAEVTNPAGNVGSSGSVAASSTTADAGRVSTGVLPPQVSVSANTAESGNGVLRVVREPSSGGMEAEPGKVFTYQVPSGTFEHSDPSAGVALEATQSDGKPLPGWLNFDAATGKFTGTPPDGGPEKIELRVVARDSSGQEAEVRILVRLVGGEATVDTPLPGDAKDGTPANPAPAGQPPRAPVGDQPDNLPRPQLQGRAGLSAQLAQSDGSLLDDAWLLLSQLLAFGDDTAPADAATATDGAAQTPRPQPRSTTI